MTPGKNESVIRLLVIAAALTVIEFSVRAGEPLPRGTPEEQGISSRALMEFVRAANQLDALHSVMLVRHGKVVTEGWWAPYDAETPHVLYSLSKSFTSTAVGLAVAEGKLNLSDPVTSFFPEDLPENPSNNLRSMRVSDLLRMNAGHEKEIPTAPDLMTTRAFLAHPVPFKPGTRFLYNTPATFMLSAIVQKVTGQPVVDYLQPRLFEPLGIEPPNWDKNVQGICLGGYGLSVRTEDIAKFGQLYLQRGRWRDHRLLPASWVDAATRLETSNGSNPNSDWDQGYGYQFWRCRHNAYRGDGAFGQFCLVLPDQDAVVAITSGIGDMQSVLNVVWEKLLPAFHYTPLPPDPSGLEALKDQLGHLELPMPEGAQSTSLASKVFGHKYLLSPNDQGWDAFILDRAELTLFSPEARSTIQFGHGQWVRGRASIAGQPERSIAAAGAWSDDTTFVGKICFTGAPQILTVRLHFEEQTVTVDRDMNVNFGSKKLPQLQGHSR